MPNTTHTLIGLTGKAGAGKNTVADIISKLIPGAEQYSLAGPLKQMALAIDPLVWVGLTPGVSADQLSYVVDVYGWDRAKQFPDVRRFLQRLGTEGVRGTFGDHAWTELMWDWWYTTDASVGVVTDVRFPNEAEHVDILIGVTRPSPTLTGENAAHASEQELSTRYVIQNNGSLDELEHSVVRVLTRLEIL